MAPIFVDSYPDTSMINGEKNMAARIEISVDENNSSRETTATFCSK